MAAESFITGGWLPMIFWGLQWGRGQTAAERSRQRRTWPAPVCFNGAAAKRPRKGDEHGAGDADDLASMGPRPNGRGKVSSGMSVCGRASGFNGAAAKRPRKVCRRPRETKVFRRLQWGRGQTAAESAAWPRHYP